MLWNLFFTIFCDIITLSYIECVPVEAIISTSNPAIYEKFHFPYRRLEKGINFPLQLSSKEFQSDNSLSDSNKVLQIESSDAIIKKYSQPITDNPNFSSINKPNMKVPRHGMNETFPVLPHQKTKPKLIDKPQLDNSQFDANYNDNTVRNFRKDYRYLDKSSNIDSMFPKTTVVPILQASQLYESSNQHDVYVKRELPVLNKNVHNRNNFTDSNESRESGFSGTVQSYEPNFDHSDEKVVIKDALSGNQNSELNFRASAKNSMKQIHNSSDSFLSSISDAFDHFSSEDLTSPNAISDKQLTLSDQYNFTSNEIFEYTTGSSLLNNENTSESISSHKNTSSKISSGVVAGIVIAILVSITALSSAVIYLLYRKFHGKCGSVTENKFNSDNCAYLDDSLHSSMYLNNHIELPKESSEEMTSLDNDSFLNSLETMTIQNYWADTSKNTKV